MARTGVDHGVLLTPALKLAAANLAFPSWLTTTQRLEALEQAGPGPLHLGAPGLIHQRPTAYCVDVDPHAPCMYEWLSKLFGRTVRTHRAMWVNHTEICCLLHLCRY